MRRHPEHIPNQEFWRLQTSRRKQCKLSSDFAIFVPRRVEMRQSSKTSDDARKKTIHKLWNDKLKGSQRIVEVQQQILAVRSLVIPPQQDQFLDQLFSEKLLSFVLFHFSFSFVGPSKIVWAANSMVWKRNKTTKSQLCCIRFKQLQKNWRPRRTLKETMDECRKKKRKKWRQQIATADQQIMTEERYGDQLEEEEISEMEQGRRIRNQKKKEFEELKMKRQKLQNLQIAEQFQKPSSSKTTNNLIFNFLFVPSLLHFPLLLPLSSTTNPVV
eukprot:TRINITY_DN1213_c0_g1_i1.p1 TRINITY_DN1213_c0_g1~~TRINITY_DN1213_c0_g1_i1.p1  ORF type:complete len:272 (-),score=58.95 TRINITY_DN1213_c0_g1_i1:922-1737(-)